MKTSPFAILHRAQDGGGTLFEPSTNRALKLNPAGVILWNAMTNGMDESECVTELMQKFPTLPRDKAESDVANFIAQLEQKSLIQR